MKVQKRFEDVSAVIEVQKDRGSSNGTTSKWFYKRKAAEFEKELNIDKNSSLKMN